MGDLADMMKELEETRLLSEVQKMKDDGIAALAILQELQEGIQRVGEEFEAGNYYLSELIMSGVMFEKAMDIIKDKLSLSDSDSEYGTFIIGTVKDDIHYIGKNIAANLLACRGFKVVDLGEDVPIATFVAAIKKHNPKVVGLSCLLTTSFDSMKKTIDAIKTERSRAAPPVIIGGATIDQSICDYVGADAYCIDANNGIKTAQRLAGGNCG
jgi:dimethylamine corrinoid protein